jgi:hypothetical protein
MPTPEENIAATLKLMLLEIQKIATQSAASAGSLASIAESEKYQANLIRKARQEPIVP